MSQDTITTPAPAALRKEAQARASQDPVIPERIVSNALKVLEFVVRDMPPHYFGAEKQEYIAKKLESIDEKAIQVLRMFYEKILARMREVDASDIDLGSFGTRGEIWFRVHGNKLPQKDLPQLPSPMADVLVQALIMPRQREKLVERRSLDFSYHVEENGERFRYRGTAYFDLDAVGMNMRAITAKIRPYSSYNFHPNITNIVNLKNTKEGLILVTGITGSGKSTTLDAIIDANNNSVDAHIIIIGAPIEYVHSPVRSVIRHREVGRDVLSFKDGTVQALRQDPDIVIIGEMRDPETIMAALEITDSGHKVFSTLHTSSAVESLDRIIGEVPPAEQDRVRNRLADVLKLVVSQKLIPTVDKKRTLAKEVLLVTPSVRAAIKNGNTGEIYQMITEGSALGMITMEQDLYRLYRSNIISIDEALNYANNKKRLRQLINKQVN
ncbi:MAG: PilT/PilU family type 4a pilus ATPase [Bacteroidota bacterium]|nr:PilT/PilU family type 4a pilus ATPase [Bacteroidota bacterium]